MYIPSSYRIDAPEKIHAFIHAHGFASLITQTKDGGAFASHLPVLLDEREGVNGRLRSHMARANPQWQHFAAGEEVLCIFHGPHSYISPSCYVMQHTVPTWNYAAVHVYGRPEIVDRPALKQIVLDTTAKYESGMPTPWKISLSESEMEGMCRAIVGFAIEITRVEAKFKFGQNRSSEDQQSMLRALQSSPDAGSRSLAELILQQSDFVAKESVTE
jgi:transcriptional regulator